MGWKKKKIKKICACFRRQSPSLIYVRLYILKIELIPWLRIPRTVVMLCFFLKTWKKKNGTNCWGWRIYTHATKEETAEVFFLAIKWLIWVTTSNRWERAKRAEDNKREEKGEEKKKREEIFTSRFWHLPRSPSPPPRPSRCPVPLGAGGGLLLKPRTEICVTNPLDSNTAALLATALARDASLRCRMILWPLVTKL